MQLLFIWIDRNLAFDDLCFTFDRKRQYTINRTEERKLSISIANRDNYVPNFFGVSIANITGIVGENGTGKTNLLEYILRLLTNQFWAGDRFAIGLGSDKGNIHIYHTLYDLPTQRSQVGRKANNEWNIDLSGSLIDISQVKVHPLQTTIGIHGEPHIAKIPKLSNTETIFYSPIVDFRNYPPNFDEPAYTDVSTNFLLYADARKGDFENVDAVERHKLENVQRQLTYLTGRLLGHPNTFDLPTHVAVSFLGRSGLGSGDSKDLSHDSSAVYKVLSGYVMRHYYDLDTSRKQGKLASAKYWFIDQLLTNFFRNLSAADDYKRKLLKESSAYWEEFLQNAPSPFKVIEEFLWKQGWCDSAPARALLEFIRDLRGSKEVLDVGQDNMLNLTLAQATKLLSLYTEYLKAFLVKSAVGFISFNWRNLSSGEKMQLDLYSRLLEARDIVTKRRTQHIKESPVYTVFLLIDEGEIGLHPHWQRQYLNSLVKFLDHWSKGGCFSAGIRVQVLLTSHSPFILSDLPRECTVLLQKVKNRVSIATLTGAERTLGANINDLLANAFFLRDSLVGDFARDKINQVIDLLTKESPLTIGQLPSLRNTIEMIAEPLIRDKLQQMLVDKLVKDGNPDVVSAEARRLEELLRRLRG